MSRFPSAIPMIIAICVVILTSVGSISAQLYVDSANARFRFAQTYCGLDMQIQSGGGNLRYASTDGILTNDYLDPRFTPRLTIGALHFWGHADFYITFAPFGNSTQRTTERGDKFNAVYALGVETGARLYPWRVEREVVRPFVGIAWQPGAYRQIVNDEAGMTLNLDRAAFSLGATYQTGNVIVEGGARFIPALDNLEYFITRADKASISMPSIAFWLGAKYVFDTTQPIEKTIQRGGLERLEKKYRQHGAMNSFTVAIGPSYISSASPSPHNEALYPFLNPRNGVTIADVGIGYYFNDIDAHLNLAGRAMNSSQRALGLHQQLSRTSIGLEGYKYFFDYHGFVPFLGAGISFEALLAEQRDRNEELVRRSGTKWLPYFIAGWDIRPTNVEWFVLRTNVRYTPNVTLTMPSGNDIRFPDLEINFIQLVINLNRLFAL